MEDTAVIKEELTQNEPSKKDPYATSRFLYIIEAALEHFISVVVAGAYLATLTSYIGISDSLTGIISSFATFACAFQLIAIFLANKRPVKRWVVGLHTTSNIFYIFIYVVPFLPVSQAVKSIIFIISILSAHAIHQVVKTPKINWFMELVDDKKRGKFTANKEIVSLIGGMIFSYTVGAVSDYFKDNGNILGAFIFTGIGILVIAVGHILSLVFSKEKPQEVVTNMPTKQVLFELIKDKTLFKVILVSVLYNIAMCATTPFFGTYKIKELGISLTFISLMGAFGSISRVLVSRPMGRFADKFSFAKLLNICFTIMTIAIVMTIFARPGNGKVIFTIYTVLHGIAMGGINSASVNLIYDYVDRDKRTSALALKNTLAGFAGFFTTLAVSPLVAFIQSNGNKFLGLNVYAQQVTSCISMILLIVLVVYINLVVKKLKLTNH